MSIPVIKEYADEFQNETAELILAIQQHEYQVAITKEEQPDLLNIKEFYQAGNGNFWVAVYEREVVGTISLLDIGSQQLALRKMFVKKEFRGPIFQTASLLLNTALKWAKDKSISAIFLGTAPQFKAAHRFYEKNGFISIKLEQLPASFPVLQVDKKFCTYLV
ncbi:GNAT family N-acetyltransferase [Metabacillus sp. KIGAM252]|uniref:GNAT family N-acetyltransferase n=1 Tax=Metabacillus flavus TaxID=2823519 RepID=A0ABS5LI17_9BACI|nr:GNAT family N-acetyltransferase [Metabacillus flavus]